MNNPRKIFFVPYCHPDWAWTFNRRWHAKRYVLVLEEVLDLLRKHPDFRWYMDTYVTELEPFLRARPGRVAELKRRVREGKIGIAGTYTNLRPSMVGEETQIRDIVIGRQLYRRLFPKADLSVYAATVDVSMGHHQMPQLLALGGYQYFRFWRPHAALTAKGIPLEFVWQGKDGSRILCSRGCYGGGWYRPDRVEEDFQTELAYNRDLSPSGLRWFAQGMDDSRPLRSVYDDVETPLFDFIKQKNREGRIAMAFATPAEYFRELEPGRKQFPIVKEPLDPCEVCYNVGWGGSNGLFRLRQTNDSDLTAAETWSALAGLRGRRETGDRLEAAWKKHLLTCAHASQWVFQEDFDELMSLARQARTEARAVQESALAFFGEHISTPRDADVVLFNRLPFAREEKIPLTFSFPAGSPSLQLRDGRGRIVPFQVRDKNERSGKIFEYFVTAKVSVPAGGFTTLSAVSEKPSGKVRSIPFSARWKGHDIVSVRLAGRHFAAGRDGPFGALAFSQVDTARGVLHVGPVTKREPVVWQSTEQKEDGPLYLRYRSEGRVRNHEISRDVYVYRDEPRITFVIEVNWRADDGFLTLEWPAPAAGALHGDTSFAVESKDLSREPFGSMSGHGKGWDIIERQRENLFFAKSFVSCSDGGNAVSYVNEDATHYYLRDGNRLANILLNSFTVRDDWERFVNEAAMAAGNHRFVGHLLFHRGDWRSFHLPRRAQALLAGIEHRPLDGPAGGKLPAHQALVSLAPDNLILTGLYRRGNRTIIRFYETEGRKTTARIALPFAARSAAKTDLLGAVRETVRGGRDIAIDVRPWEIVTLQISLK